MELDVLTIRATGVRHLTPIVLVTAKLFSHGRGLGADRKTSQAVKMVPERNNAVTKSPMPYSAGILLAQFSPRNMQNTPPRILHLVHCAKPPLCLGVTQQTVRVCDTNWGAAALSHSIGLVLAPTTLHTQKRRTVHIPAPTTPYAECTAQTGRLGGGDDRGWYGHLVQSSSIERQRTPTGRRGVGC